MKKWPQFVPDLAWCACTYESWKSINCCFLVHRYLTRSTVHPIGPRKCINQHFKARTYPIQPSTPAHALQWCTKWYAVEYMPMLGNTNFCMNESQAHAQNPSECMSTLGNTILCSTEVTVPIQKVVYCMLSHVHASLCTTKVNVDIISCGRLCSVCPLPSSASLYTCKDRA